MRFADIYISKNRGKYFFEPVVFSPLKLIVVIPCFNEPEIRHTISSLFECEYPGVETGIVVVVNSSENCSENVLAQNRETINELNDISLHSQSRLQLFVIEVENLPEKHSGVGWARKIGMDWAIAHFNFFSFENGIVLSLDADTLVEANYLKSVCNYFEDYPKKVAATINFEHAFHPHDFRDEVLDKASAFYELFIRYYRNALVYTGFPNSIYTVGSCFAVKAGAYVAQGGMNRKKAGEDFYFLHKIALLGEIGEINTTTVYPSSRLSDRVPFGTGVALRKYYDGNRSVEFSYPIEAFEVMKNFFSNIERFYYLKDKIRAEDFSTDASFISFCIETKLPEEISELTANCSSFEVFRKRFFHLFNAFRVLKWLNYSLPNGFPPKNLLKECSELLVLTGIDNANLHPDPFKMLALFRSLDKNRTNHSII